MSLYITHARVESFGSIRNVQLSDLPRGLTGVYGANGSGKSTVLAFLRGAFGDRSATFWHPPHTTPAGRLETLGQDGRRQASINGRSGFDLLDSKTDANLSTVASVEASDTSLVEKLAEQSDVSLADQAIDLSKERAARAELVVKFEALTGPDGPILHAESTLGRIDALIHAARAEYQRTQDRLAAQHQALLAALESTGNDVDRTHAAYQAAQTDLSEWESDAWRPRRVLSVKEVTHAKDAPQPTKSDLRTALLEIAKLRCKASSRRAEAASGGPLDLCGKNLAQPLAIADELRQSLDRLRTAAGTVPAAGLAARVDELITSLAEQQRAVDWIEADHTRVILDRCERDLERAALTSCSVCGQGTSACGQDQRYECSTVESLEAPADAGLGEALRTAKANCYQRWQNALARHRQALRQLTQFLSERARLNANDRIAQLLTDRDAAAARLASGHQERLRLEHSIAELDAILLQDRAPSGPLVNAANYFRELTCGAYTTLKRERATEAILARTASGHEIPLGELSRGTRTQAALAMRLAVLDELDLRGNRLPLILDDVLVDSDRDRALAAVKLLKHWAENRQVVLMTCQRQLIDAMREHGVSVKTLESDTAIGKSPRRESVAVQAPQQTTLRTTVKPSPESVRLAVTRSFGEPKRSPSTASKPLASARQPEPETPKYWLDADSMIIQISSIRESDARRLRNLGIESIEHLVLVDIADIEDDLIELQINPRTFARWQSEATLVTLVPGLSGRDAEILAWAGIKNPGELSNIELDELRVRLRRIGSDAAASHLGLESDTLSTERLTRWRTRARQARSASKIFRNRATLRSGRQRRSTPTGGGSNRSPQSGRTLSVVERRRSMRRDGGRSGSRKPRTGRPNQTSTAAVVTTMTASKTTTTSSEVTTEWRHYLETKSPVVEAPSIGPKMAKRLGKQGIKTVSDLVTADANRVSQKLDDRRIKKQTVVDWQDQSRLMCCIPMLRGHDAQVLVACGYRDVARIAGSSPSELFKIVGPFVSTKEGERLLRSSKVPDLEEVTDWINWARHARALKAA